MGEVRVVVERDGAVRRVILDRPAKRNALMPSMFDALIAAFELEPPAAERVTVIQAEGTTFCAGVDLAERVKNGWPQISPLVRLCEAMRVYPLPIVAAIQGDAIAGGCMMATHCDFIVAQQGARLGMPLSQLGIAPPWILTSRCLDRVGPALGREMVLLGYPVSVERLAEANAINIVATRDDFRPAVERIVDRLVMNAPLSLRAVKAALAVIGDAGGKDSQPVADKLTRFALDSLDAREGMRARLERRQPNFQGK